VSQERIRVIRGSQLLVPRQIVVEPHPRERAVQMLARRDQLGYRGWRR
jgi:hypothetical protein